MWQWDVLIEAEKESGQKEQDGLGSRKGFLLIPGAVLDQVSKIAPLKLFHLMYHDQQLLNLLQHRLLHKSRGVSIMIRPHPG